MRVAARLATLLAALAVTAGLLLGCSAPPTPAPGPYEAPRELRSCTSSVAAQTALVMIDRRPLDEAAKATPLALEMYRSALVTNPNDPCAILGVVVLTTDPPEVDKPKSFATSLGNRWTSFVSTYLSPLAGPLGAAVGLALLLFVAARLLTPHLVGINDVSWSESRRRSGFNIGCALIATASVWPVVMSAATLSETGRLVVGTVLALVGLIGAIAAVDQYTRGRDSRVGDRLAPWVAALLGVTGILGLVALAVTAATGIIVARIAAGVLVGTLGFLLLALAAGQALRLVVEVQSASGTTDANATRYLVSRLANLGSSRSRGLEIPRDTDVTKLPADALTALPESALAKALKNVLLAARPGFPWKADVALHDTSAITVLLSRNGRPAGSTYTLTCRQLKLEVDASTDQGKAAANRALLTAAAAHILLELSRRHLQLRIGLGGASRSLSLGLHAVASDPASGLDGPVTARMQAAAVADDPRNELARVADLDRLGKDPGSLTQRKVAEEAEHILAELWRVPGMECLSFRLAFTIVAARINVTLQATSERERYYARQDLARTTEMLLTVLDDGVSPTRDPAVRDFCRMVQASARYLVATAVLVRALPLNVALPQWANVKLEDPRPPGPSGAYHRACWLATRDGVRGQQAVFEDLRLAFTDPILREWAKKDPSFDELRGPEGRPTAFDKLFDEPRPTNALDLPALRPYRKRLEEVGITNGDDLLRVPTGSLARALKLPRSIARKWRSVARDHRTEEGAPTLTQ